MKLKTLFIKNHKAFKDFSLDVTQSDGEALDLVVLAGINGSGKTTLLEFIRDNHDETDYIIYLDVSKPDTTNIEQSIIKFVDMIVYEQEKSAKVAYQEMQDKLSILFEQFGLIIQFKTLNKDKKVFFTNKRGEEIELSQLSTGEQALLSKLFYFYLADVRDSIILIDEPELSLHPKWQSHIVALYRQLAKEKNNQIILATHSPQIIASTPPESLFLLTWEGDKIVAKNADGYGMTVNDVLLKVMEVDSLRDPAIQAKYDDIENKIITGDYRTSETFQTEFAELETLMINDPIELGLLRAEKMRQDKKYAQG